MKHTTTKHAINHKPAKRPLFDKADVGKASLALSQATGAYGRITQYARAWVSAFFHAVNGEELLSPEQRKKLNKPKAIAYKYALDKCTDKVRSQFLEATGYVAKSTGKGKKRLERTPKSVYVLVLREARRAGMPVRGYARTARKGSFTVILHGEKANWGDLFKTANASKVTYAYLLALLDKAYKVTETK